MYKKVMTSDDNSKQYNGERDYVERIPFRRAMGRSYSGVKAGGDRVVDT